MKFSFELPPRLFAMNALMAPLVESIYRWKVTDRKPLVTEVVLRHLSTSHRDVVSKLMVCRNFEHDISLHTFVRSVYSRVHQISVQIKQYHSYVLRQALVKAYKGTHISLQPHG